LNGSVQFIKWQTSPWHTTNGDFTVIIMTAEDITQQKLTEETLRAKEERLTLAQEFANVGTWWWDVRTGLSAFNPTYYALFGLAKHTSHGYQDCWKWRAIKPGQRTLA
jgi:PAS domain-containing protein